MLLKKNQDDWDDRIKLNHRFWMNEYTNDDLEMFETGARDLKLILEEVDQSNVKSWEVLEYGCGVGRILNSASDIFKNITGVDISGEAINKANQLVQHKSNIKCLKVKGSDLEIFENNKFDFCYSFACLNHITIEYLPRILLEISRVIKVNGLLVLQFYIGSFAKVEVEDTLLIRGYPEENLLMTFNKLGLEVIKSKELKLPFDTKDHERGFTPHLFTLKKIKESDSSIFEIKNTLNPEGEIHSDSKWPGSHYEYRLAATLLKEQSKKGEIDEAIKTLEFALSKYKIPDSGSVELLEAMKKMAKDDVK